MMYWQRGQPPPPGRVVGGVGAGSPVLTWTFSGVYLAGLDMA